MFSSLPLFVHRYLVGAAADREGRHAAPTLHWAHGPLPPVRPPPPAGQSWLTLVFRSASRAQHLSDATAPPWTVQCYHLIGPAKTSSKTSVQTSCDEPHLVTFSFWIVCPIQILQHKPTGSPVSSRFRSSFPKVFPSRLGPSRPSPSRPPHPGAVGRCAARRPPTSEPQRTKTAIFLKSLTTCARRGQATWRRAEGDGWLA